ncbi:hypothetical protein [Nitrosopumilus ureiphilus]|uniref:Uncharacterized protein n=1 Tax=Nitrosopumilus ureiphilus TaxID=1470067 RepID=A0A7D5RFT1_9ARCH|nr:hypothetical protein [Nitrosopumilus ureiphilus]QLH06005.1 hypothetical protein C5F50_02125 [Nitrosopumilus ureiphilus]
MPDTLLSDSTKSLNQSGMFLQSLISKELDFDGWSVDTEYPVQVSPFTVDPIKHGNYSIDEYTKKPVYHPQDIIRSMEECKNKIELEETSIDVVGTIGKDPTITLCVECKKLDPIYSDWIFFDVSKPKPMNVIIKSFQSKGHVSLFKIPETSSCGNEVFVDLHKWEDSNALRNPVSNTSIALTNNKIDRKTYQSNKSLIDNASRQIIKGTYGFILDKLQSNILQGFIDSTLDTIIPIIVTTANLQKCIINPKDIDLDSGYVTKEPVYEKIDSIIYECPAPKSVRFPQPNFNRLSPETRKEISKWQVLITSPKGFIDFMKQIC